MTNEEAYAFFLEQKEGNRAKKAIRNMLIGENCIRKSEIDIAFLISFGFFDNIISKLIKNKAELSTLEPIIEHSFKDLKREGNKENYIFKLGKYDENTICIYTKGDKGNCEFLEIIEE